MSSLDELPVMRFAAAGGGAVVKWSKLVLPEVLVIVSPIL